MNRSRCNLFSTCNILQGRRCILAGDHLQLSPTVQSPEAEKKGYGRTLFERLTALYGGEVTSMLTVQYRMHELIMKWSSHELYDDKVFLSVALIELAPFIRCRPEVGAMKLFK